MAQCSKCNGSGKISFYSHIDNGVCFSCNGTGQVAKSRKNSIHISKVTDENIVIAKRVYDSIIEGKKVKGSDVCYEILNGDICITSEFGSKGTTLLGLQLDVQYRNFKY